MPVSIAGTLGENVSARDLYLSSAHAVFVNDVLVPVKFLINRGTIRQIPATRMDYYHIELASHDVLLAEGLTVDSYLDTGDRSSFANGGGAVALHPEFSAHRGETLGRAKLIVTGPELEATRRTVEAASRITFAATLPRAIA